MLKIGMLFQKIFFALLFVSGGTYAQSITVSATGEILRDGVVYRAVGVNYVDAFWRVMDSPGDTSYEQGFADLAAEKIPFARIAVTPFWPVKLREYLSDRESYLARLDGVVQSAEVNDIGLVMSMYWADFALPDVAGEPRNKWGNLESKTIALMREYTETVVSRYVDSPAIWIWEFGNEYNLAVDLPNASTHRPPVVPQLGTPETRSAADEIDSEDILVAYGAFVETIRAIDSRRPITSGNSMSRAFAERIRGSEDWSPIDTREEFQENIALVNPEGMNVISVHLYPDHRMEDRFEMGAKQSYRSLLEATKEVGATKNKAVFLGEFGASMRTLQSDSEISIEFDKFLDAIVQSHVDLAAVWNFDFSNQGSASQAMYTITRDNALGYMLDKIRETNERLSVQANSEN
jgi:hypothetical protein